MLTVEGKDTFEMLKKAGLSVQVEPDLPGTDQKIDFLAYPPAERSRHFYLEATVAGFGKSVLMPSPNERDVIERIRKGIEKIPNLHSDVWLETDGNLPENLSNEHVRYIVGKFSELLDAHTADEVLRRDEAERLDWRVNSIGTRLVRPYKESDWTIGGHLAPYVSPSQGGRVHGPVRGGFVDGSRSLSTALRRKAEDWSRFDFADLPFIIAVNVCDPDFLWMMNNIRNALFENPDRTEPLGKFRRELHPVNAVIVVGKAVLGHERGTKAQMFRNGDAEIPESLRFILEEQKYEDILGI